MTIYQSITTGWPVAVALIMVSPVQAAKRPPSVPSKKPSTSAGAKKQTTKRPTTPASRVAPRLTPVAWWPVAPLGGKPILSPNILGPDPIRIQVGNHTGTAPANNLAFSTKAGEWRGRVVYLPSLYAQPASLPYLVFGGVGVLGNVAEQKVSQAFYPLQGPGYFQAPQFSPDGKSLLFRYGDPPADATATSQVYLWDLNNQQIATVGTYELLSSMYQMSSDSRYIAINYAGTQAPTAWQRDLSTSSENWSRLLIRDIGPRGARTAKGYPFKDQWISHEAAKRPLIWTSRNTLLFTMPTGKPVFTSQPFDPAKTNYTRVSDANPRPCVAEVAPGAQPAKLIDQGYDPVPSPDNRFVAFFGWPIASSATADEKPGFYLFERATKRRFRINESGAGQVVWSHAGQKLLLCETLPGSGGNQYEGRITQWNLSDILEGVPDTPKSGRVVTTLQAQDAGGGISRGSSAPLFQVKNVSRDNRLLFVSSDSVAGAVGTFASHKYILQSVELETGRVEEVATLDDPQGRVIGWDWLDETPMR